MDKRDLLTVRIISAAFVALALALFKLAFCSFAIGLYWRFHFRNEYLAAELEEMQQINERLECMNASISDCVSADATNIHTVNQPSHQTITLMGTTSESVTLQVYNLLYIESVGNYVKVCHLTDSSSPARPNGVALNTLKINQSSDKAFKQSSIKTDMLRATSKQMEETLKGYSMIVRCHRAFLVNLQQVEKIVSQSGALQLKMKHTGYILSVSRSNTAQIKAAFQ